MSMAQRTTSAFKPELLTRGVGLMGACNPMPSWLSWGARVAACRFARWV